MERLKKTELRGKVKGELPDIEMVYEYLHKIKDFQKEIVLAHISEYEKYFENRDLSTIEELIQELNYFIRIKTDVKKQQLLEKQVNLLTEQLNQQRSQHRKVIYGIFGTASLLIGTITHLSVATSWTTQYGLIDSSLMLAGIGFLIASLRKA